MTRPGTEHLAELSAAAYNTYPREKWREGVEIDGTRYEIIDQTSGRSGYQGTLFRNAETGAFVVAHRGTEFDRQLVRDGVIADGGMVLAGINSQAAAAVAFTEKAIATAQRRNEMDGCDVPSLTVTGHSLGGTLAQLTATRHGLKAETFEAYGAAGLVADLPRDNPDILNHVRASSFVSAASPHVGEVRVYTTEEDLAAMQRHGYANDDRRATDLRNPLGVAFGAGVAAHYSSNFLASSEGGSQITDANLARTEEYRAMVEKYRGDVGAMHGTLALPRNAVDGVADGVAYVGGKVADGVRHVLGIEREPSPALPTFSAPEACAVLHTGETRNPAAAQDTAQPRASASPDIEILFDRLATKTIAGDPNPLLVGREYAQSEQGQLWLARLPEQDRQIAPHTGLQERGSPASEQPAVQTPAAQEAAGERSASAVTR